VSSVLVSDTIQPVLLADGLVLRLWEGADAASVVAASADPDIERWHVRSMTRTEASEWIQGAHSAW
jgi:hypothetical protein